MKYLKRLNAAVVLICLGRACFVRAGELILPSSTLERDSIVRVAYRMASTVTGHAVLAIYWSDSLGRTVEDETIAADLTDESEIGFPLDLRRAVAMKNTLRVHVSIDGKNRKGEPDRRTDDVESEFVARPLGRQWRDYAIVMWQEYPTKVIQDLQQLGIDGGQWSGRSQSLPDFLIDNNQRWYSENIGTDYYSEYHRYRPDRIQNWSFLQAKEMYKDNPSSLEAFKRHPSFWDPVWRREIHDRLVGAATRNSPYRPFFYSLADESGIADLAAFWDFDFSDQSLVPMRAWLRETYSTLAALNEEWGTNFTAWDMVTPPTTHDAMLRKDDNFAAWADFKAWMDISYASALHMGADAIHEVDRDAYVSIGGGQMPGWGGYDYSRITQAINAIEPYDIGNNVEIIRSLNPGMPMVSTGFANGKWERQRVWRELFHGHRGLIIWDQKREYVSANGQPGPRGVEASEYYKEIRGGIGALVVNSRPVVDPIAIHYSQPSMRTEWMLARRPEGDAWINRGARMERSDNEFLRLRESWCQLIEDQGLQYNFVSYGQIETGELLKRGYRILVLPRSSALSPAEARAIREFVAQGGAAIADGEPGAFDEHSRRLAASPLADLFGGPREGAVTVRTLGSGKAISLHIGTLSYLEDRLVQKEGPVHKLVGDLLRSNGANPDFAVTGPSGQPIVGVETHVFENGGVRLISLLSNPLLRVNELGPPDFRSNRRFEKPAAVTLTLPAPMYVYDVRQAKSLGDKRWLALTVDPYEPIVLAVSPVPLPNLQVFAPSTASRGSTIQIGIACLGTPAAVHIESIQVVDPQRRTVRPYSGNVFAERGKAVKSIPLAVNDPAGRWTVRIHDLLSGQIVVRDITVN